MKALICFLMTLTVTGSLISGCEKDFQTLTARVVNTPKCKSSKSAALLQDKPDTLSCVNYLYDKSTKKLSLHHINAGFNCCPGKLFCDVTISGDTLIIKEIESTVGCHCNCLYDMEIEVTGVEPKVYQVKFIEPYAGGQEQIIFRTDLVNQTEGSYCVDRIRYPWGAGL